MKKAKIILTMLALISVSASVSVSSASAISRTCGIVNNSWGYSNCSHNGNTFSGTRIDKKTDGYCVQIMRKTGPAKNDPWTKRGVNNGLACTTGQADDWYINANKPVYGLRIYKQGTDIYATICANYDACHTNR
jgi:hypothetical protein